MSRIKEAFKEHKAFIAFITCGDPDLDTTKKVVHCLQDNGVDLIELGMPFSDPTAEGPVIQEADNRALKAGCTTDKIFQMVRELRAENITVPMVFMTYANVVYSYGSEKFISICKDINIDGLILPDIPYEEKDEFDPICKKYDIDLMSLIAPTSKNRITKIAKESSGFVYIVSSLGVTGVRDSISSDIEGMVKLIREGTDNPCAVGFGIQTPEQAANMARLSDGAIVGSAIIKIIAKYGKGCIPYVAAYVKPMTDAVHAVK